MYFNDISTCILAGGKNSRMSGYNKAFLSLSGQAFIENTIRLLESLFREIILITNSPREFKQFDRRVILAQDKIKNIGPLGGMHSGLSRTTKEAVFFTACDMPFLHNDMIRFVVDNFKKMNYDAVVPRTGGLIEPLHAVYKKELKQKIESYIKDTNDHSIKGFLKGIRVHYLDFDEKEKDKFLNINTQEDFEEAIKHSESKI